MSGGRQTVSWEEYAPRFATIPVDKVMTMKEIGAHIGLPSNRRQSGTLYKWADICAKRGWMERIEGLGKSDHFVRRKEVDPKHLWRFYQEEMKGKAKANPRKPTSREANLANVREDVGMLQQTLADLQEKTHQVAVSLDTIIRRLTGGKL